MHKQAYIHLLPRGALETQNVGCPKQNFKMLAFLKLNTFKTVAASHKCICFSDPLACLFTISLPMSPSTSCILSLPSSSTRTRDLSISLRSTNLGALVVQQSAPLQRPHEKFSNSLLRRIEHGLLPNSRAWPKTESAETLFQVRHRQDFRMLLSIHHSLTKTSIQWKTASDRRRLHKPYFGRQLTPKFTQGPRTDTKEARHTASGFRLSFLSCVQGESSPASTELGARVQGHRAYTPAAACALTSRRT
jgi:hypothetical protein